MLIKSRDDNAESVKILKKLLKLPSLTSEHDFLINRELRNIQKGAKGEKSSAYYLDFGFGESSKNWALIHDLRLEVNGRVAQIDHLLINRTFEFYVLETKNFHNGIEINEKGEFTALYYNKNYGIPSPVEQNERHIAVLKDFFKETNILPTRLGLAIKPTYFNYILMSPESIIKRPSTKHFNTDSIIKADTFKKVIEDELKILKTPKLSDLKEFTDIVKVVSSHTIRTLANEIISFHTPHQTNYIKKFGIKKFEGEPKTPVENKPVFPKSTPSHSANKYFCFKCKKTISEAEAKFCWQDRNKVKFNNKPYCMACQKLV